MTQLAGCDPTFDFRNEASGDPDEHSPTLRAYHKLLWSKPLPSGDMFELNVIDHVSTLLASPVSTRRVLPHKRFGDADLDRLGEDSRNDPTHS